MVASSLGGASPLFFVHGASALSTTTATPSNTQGWGAQDGNPTYVAGPSGADGYGSLKLTTDAQSKQDYFHGANTPLTGISGLSYKVDVTAGVPASYQLQVTGVHRTDSSSTFTSLVWEPVYNGQVNGPNGGFVTESNLENGVWWSSHPIDGDTLGNNGFVSLSQIQTANPNATIVAYGVNVGSGTPGATSYVDDVSFQSDVTNFETDAPAAPTALAYHYTADDQHDNAASLACGAVVNSNKPSTYHTGGSLNLTWTAPAGDVSGYQVQTTYPDGTPFDQNNDGYQGSNNWSWLTFTHGEGTYTYQVRARNTAGQWSAYSAPCSIVYDKTAPVVTVTPAAGSLLSGTVTFNITVTDDNLAHNGAKTWVYLYDNGGTQKSKGASIDLSNGSGTFTVDTTQLDDGLATLDVGKLYDAAGNASGTGDSYFKNYTIDNTAPTLPTLLTPPNNGYETTNDFYFTWTSSTDASAVTYEFQSDNDGSFTSPWDSITNGNSEQNNLTTPKIHSTGAPDGTYYWRVRAIDAAGNKSAWTGAWKMTIDTQAPTALITSPSNNQILSTRATSGKLNLTGTASDSDFNYYYCYVTDAHGEVGTRSSRCVTAWAAGTPFQSAFAQTAQGTTNGSLGYVDMTGLGDGDYTVHLVAKDKAGNTTEATQPFVLDNTRPSLSFTAPASFAAFYPAGPTVKVSASDARGLSTLAIHIYNASTNQLLASPSCTATSAELASGQLSCDLSGLAEGTYYVKAGANDTAGNNQTITSAHFTVDHTAPVASIDAYSGTDTTPTLTGKVNDPTASLTVAIDGGTAQPATNKGDGTWSFDIATALSVGSHTVVLTATDTVGNAYQTTADVLVQAPHASPTGLAASQNNGNSNQATGHQPTVTVTPNNDGQVLGDTASNTDSGSTGKVKGDSVVTLKNASSTKSNFLVLGWWWLAIIAVLGAFWLILAKRRSSDEG